MLFGKRKNKVRHCANGHLLDPSWDSCPYCEGGSDLSGDFIPVEDERGSASAGRGTRAAEVMPPAPHGAAPPAYAPPAPAPAAGPPAWPGTPAAPGAS